MQVIVPPRARPHSVPTLSVVTGLAAGAICLAVAAVVGYVSVATPFLGTISTGGPPTAGRILIGVLAWAVALTAPIGFGLVGLLRIVAVVERLAYRERLTPTVRAASRLGDDHHVGVAVRLPDGRTVPELVIGPFGAAVVAELPSARTIRRLGLTWERRMDDGRWRSIEGPLDKAVRDAERVRRWFAAEDRDFVVKVHAAVVDASGSLERNSACAVVTPDQLPAWLAALPAQRGMSIDRRARLVHKVRGAV